MFKTQTKLTAHNAQIIVTRSLEAHSLALVHVHVHVCHLWIWPSNLCLHTSNSILLQ